MARIDKPQIDDLERRIRDARPYVPAGSREYEPVNRYNTIPAIEICLDPWPLVGPDLRLILRSELIGPLHMAADRHHRSRHPMLARYGTSAKPVWEPDLYSIVHDAIVTFLRQLCHARYPSLNFDLQCAAERDDDASGAVLVDWFEVLGFDVERYWLRESEITWHMDREEAHRRGVCLYSIPCHMAALLVARACVLSIALPIGKP